MFSQLEEIENKIRRKTDEYNTAMAELEEQKKFLLGLLSDYGTLPRSYKLAVDLHKRLCLDRDCLWCAAINPGGLPAYWDVVDAVKYLRLANTLIHKIDLEIGETEYFGNAFEVAKITDRIINAFLNTVYDE